MKKISIYKAMKRADEMSKSRDDEFIDMMDQLNRGGNKCGKKTRYSNRQRKTKN